MRKPRAIIFDDEVIILDLLKALLAKRGYEVLTYSEPVICPLYEKSGDKCDKEYPCADVVITDLQMPRMSGIELLHCQLERGCPVTIKNKALVTTELDTENEETVRKLGCAFIGKPIKLSVLGDWLDGCETRFDLSRPLA